MQASRLIRIVLLSAICLLPRPAVAGEYVLFYHNDALGSPVALTDSSGNVMWRVDYEPFGNLASIAETLPNTREFIGKQHDPETGLHYFGARFYDGGIGRFLSQDSALSGGMPKLALRNPQYLNRYAYSLNNPYRYVDPNGQIGIPATVLLIGSATLAIYSVYSAYQTLHDPNASPLEQGLAVAGAILGMVGPGGISGKAGQEILQSVVKTTMTFATRAEARAALSGAQGKAVNAFFKGATSKSTDFKISELENGAKRLEFFSRADKETGYGKRYVQEINSEGRVTTEYKQTVTPEGLEPPQFISGGPGVGGVAE